MKITLLLKSIIPTISQFLFLAVLICTAWLSYDYGARQSGFSPTPKRDGSSDLPKIASHPKDKNGDGVIYISPMHPQIQQDEPGNCPICGMELVATKVSDAGISDNFSEGEHIHAPEEKGYACAMNCVPPLTEPGDCPVCGMEMQPVSSTTSIGDSGSNPRKAIMSPEAVSLANVETTPVRRGKATKGILMVGEIVEVPERRYHLSANVGGRIDVLHARFDRDTVEKGQPIVEIYSPELLAVQEELIQSVAALERWEKEGNKVLSQTAQESINTIRRRLLLAGLTSAQIDTIEKGGKALDKLSLESPVGGVVSARYVEQGQYVEKEQRIVTISDYSVLWAELEAFSSDLELLAPGMPVRITTPAQPGRVHLGKIDWVDPISSSDTRTGKVRVIIQNDSVELKPGMYVRAYAEATLPGEPILIPHTSPLVTGSRAVVYVLDTTASTPTFFGREVELGIRAEEGYIVLSGLVEGEKVVTRGAFQIDSSLQILALPSIMNPEKTAKEQHQNPEQASTAGTDEVSLNADAAQLILTPYLRLQLALAADNEVEAKREWTAMSDAIHLSGNQPLEVAVSGDQPMDITSLRLRFQTVSNELLTYLNQFNQPIVHVHCPMAFDGKGAGWLQVGREVANPYYGSKMLRCGKIVGEVKP
ncbi:MAG: efflux RND transporter periplasmic adaptor subunit [Candidatus Sumerlaeia bacterium]|nr:efflux RND transporter periplasmic adaptor subunit [Candidatus Sumerlaeia bacterium]